LFAPLGQSLKVREERTAISGFCMLHRHNAFREDELVYARTFLKQCIVFGWVVGFLVDGDFFVYLKDNRQICFTSRSSETLAELRDYFAEWNPTDEDPMVAKMAQIANARRVSLKKKRP
jgi:hypothetical protein